MNVVDPGAFPPLLRAHLQIPALAPLWITLRDRLERSGHAVRGAVDFDLDDEAADRLAGLLGRPLRAGPQRLKLAELDAALRHSAAGRGLVASVAALTGQPLRDRPAEKVATHEDWQRVWQQLEDRLVVADLARRAWSGQWAQWLHFSGVITRLGSVQATVELRAAVDVLTEIAAALDTAVASPQSLRAIGELASRTTGSAHGLDDGRTTAALVLRAAAFALDCAPALSAAQRRELWQRVGIEPDLISGTVLVWSLRPPGLDPWSTMMRTRADLGLITHLTVHELRRFDGPLTDAGAVVHGCENPQVLQALAEAGVDQPLVCLSGNPSAAGLALVGRVDLRYHGDFDWPGIAIARRLFTAGARPWRMNADDYLAAVSAHQNTTRLTLSGRSEPTPWSPDLEAAMIRAGVAVHEESVIDALAADFQRSVSE